MEAHPCLLLFFSKRGNELDEQKFTEENHPLPESDVPNGTQKTGSRPYAIRQWIIFCLASLLFGVLLAFFCGMIETQHAAAAFAKPAEPGFWITALMLGLMALTINLLFHHLLVGSGITAAAAVVISLINFYKVQMTATPLSIGDFALAARLNSIISLNSSAITVSFITAAAVLLVILSLIGLGVLSRFCRLRWRWSVIGSVLSWGIFTLLFWGLPETLFFAPLQVSTAQAMEQSTVNDYCSGPLLGLWRGLYYTAHRDYDLQDIDSLLEQAEAQAISNTEEEEESDAEEADSLTEEEEEEEEDDADTADDVEIFVRSTEQANIILLLSESFFDITELDGVTFDDDPIAAYHALQEESVSGTFYTRSLGYGTCNVELEVLTGMNTGLLAGEDLYSFDASVFSSLPAVPSVLADNGYYTAFLHTYDDSVYGRSAIYPNLGIQDIYFSGDFKSFFTPLQEAAEYWTYMQTRISGGYYSDELLTELIIAKYEDAMESGEERVFLFAASMENHQPYNNSKYEEDEITVSFEADGLSDEAAEILTAVAQGCHNASEALAELVDYYRDCDEPTIIIFFGDHRPGMGTTDNDTVYNQLGIVSASKTEWSLEDYAELYSTDYLIWANDESLLPQEAGTTLDTSCNYLGALILELANVELPTYWQLISTLSETRLIDTVSYHLGTDGTLTDSIPTEGMDAVRLSLLTDMITSALYGQTDEE